MCGNQWHSKGQLDSEVDSSKELLELSMFQLTSSDMRQPIAGFAPTNPLKDRGARQLLERCRA